MNEPLLKTIENPDEVILYGEMSSIIILIHDEEHPFEEKVFPNNMLKWCGDEMYMHLTLGSISRQLRAIGVQGSIIVIYESALDGAVFRYGNHGDIWERIGILAGWA